MMKSLISSNSFLSCWQVKDIWLIVGFLLVVLCAISGLLNLSTIDIFDQIFLCCGQAIVIVVVIGCLAASWFVSTRGQ